MNPMEAAWLVLKAPTEGYDDEYGTNPQQPTMTDFMGYTRPQLEQMLIMFQNELVRRGHTSGGGNENVTVPREAFDTYQTGESRGTSDESLNTQDLMTRLMAGETLTPEELIHLQESSIEELATGQNIVDNPLGVDVTPINRATPINATPNAVRASLASHDIDPSVIQDEHVRQYQDFLRTYGRHPTREEIDMHLG